MRLVAWNCNMGLHRKAGALDLLQSDIAIVLECANAEQLQIQARGAFPFKESVWAGDNPNKGLGVFATAGYRLRIHPSYDPSHRIIIPIEVSGTHRFNLLAIWSFNDRHLPRSQRGRGPVLRALEHYKDFCRQAPLVVAGDFNNNVLWDRPGKERNFKNVVEALSKQDLTSVYHHNNSVHFGEESTPTLFWRDRAKNGRTYHVDYVFLPGPWLSGVKSVKVGQFEDWVGNKLSDHVPIIVDIDLPDADERNQ